MLYSYSRLLVFGVQVILFLALLSCEEHRNVNNSIVINKEDVAAPFKMSAITYPDFSKCPQFLITDFGAELKNKDKTSEAIAVAIAKAHNVSGGTVVIPAGEWVTSKIHFKSNVNLHLEKGAILIFSPNPDDYLPPVHTSWEGMECYN